jgi:nicotinamide-nucleotide amidase
VIVTVGDELLQGDRLDTNARWLARGLHDASFRVVEILSVGDDEAEIARALDEASRLAAGGVVVTTGGLGPTLDDRTREATARFLSVELDEDPELLASLAARFRSRGHPDLPPLNRRLAKVPRGGRILPNARGSAPGLEFMLVEDPVTLLFLLPGVPSEMEALFHGPVLESLDRRLPRRLDRPFAVVVRTTGIAESALAAELERSLPGGLDVNLQYRPSVEGVELRFSATGVGADSRLDRALEAVEPVLAPWRYGGAEATLEAATLDACRRLGWTLATAESCTGGMIGSRLTGVPGCSDVYQGSVTAYANRAKETLLGVPESLLAAEGAVSEGVVRAMARGALEALGATISVAVTGVAGPGGGSEDRPVGTVWFAVAGGGMPVEAERASFPGDRDEIRRRATQHALRMVWKRAVARSRDG